MICKKCGIYLESNASFCHNCGARLIVGEEYSRIEKKCPLCNSMISDEEEVCHNCGAELKAKVEEENISSNEFVQGQKQETATPNHIKSNNFVTNYPVFLNEKFEKPVSIGQYIGWMLLSIIPMAGFIITIVFACDSNKKSRANFFRAMLILYGVGIVISILMAILILSLGIQSAEIIESFSSAI